MVWARTRRKFETKLQGVAGQKPGWCRLGRKSGRRAVSSSATKGTLRGWSWLGVAAANLWCHWILEERPPAEDHSQPARQGKRHVKLGCNGANRWPGRLVEAAPDLTPPCAWDLASTYE